MPSSRALAGQYSFARRIEIYDSHALRNFPGIDLSQQGVPDITTLTGFRHLHEANNSAQAMLVEVNAVLIERGLILSKGTTVARTEQSRKERPDAKKMRITPPNNRNLTFSAFP